MLHVAFPVPLRLAGSLDWISHGLMDWPSLLMVCWNSFSLQCPSMFLRLTFAVDFLLMYVPLPLQTDPSFFHTTFLRGFLRRYPMVYQSAVTYITSVAKLECLHIPWFVAWHTTHTRACGNHMLHTNTTHRHTHTHTHTRTHTHTHTHTPHTTHTHTHTQCEVTVVVTLLE